MKLNFKINSKLEIFPQKGGWHFVRVPKSISEELLHKAERGVIAINATIGNVSWKTSLLPMGDGTHFIALNAKVRKNENLNLGDQIEIHFNLR
jgi:hypothetical protein